MRIILLTLLISIGSLNASLGTDQSSQWLCKESVLELFKDIIGSPKDYVVELIDAMFDDKIINLTRPHSDAQIKKGWECLVKRILEAEGDEDKCDEVSKTAALHLGLLKVHFPDLAKKVKPFPCSACLETAKYEFGL